MVDSQMATQCGAALTREQVQTKSGRAAARGVRCMNGNRNLECDHGGPRWHANCNMAHAERQGATAGA
eukprot:13239053-Alexandrium_andersonii.AAC.2